MCDQFEGNAYSVWSVLLKVGCAEDYSKRIPMVNDHVISSGSSDREAFAMQ